MSLPGIVFTYAIERAVLTSDFSYFYNRRGTASDVSTCLSFHLPFETLPSIAKHSKAYSEMISGGPLSISDGDTPEQCMIYPATAAIRRLNER